MPVPLFDPSTPRAPLRGALAAAAQEVLDAGVYVLGPQVAAFERELAANGGVCRMKGLVQWCKSDA